jgi:hypothetical protein
MHSNECNLKTPSSKRVHDYYQIRLESHLLIIKYSISSQAKGDRVNLRFIDSATILHNLPLAALVRDLWIVATFRKSAYGFVVP